MGHLKIELRVYIPHRPRVIQFLFSAVPGEPQNVKVDVLNSTSVKVTWTPPSDGEKNGIIRGYQIHIQMLTNEVM